MNGQVLQFGRVHHDAEALLPWFVNGTLDDEDRSQVAAHLEECVQCRGEVQTLRAFHAEYAKEEPAGPVNHSLPAFRALRERLTPQEVPAWHVRALQRLRTLRRPERWLPWAVALQSVLIVAIGVQLFDADQRISSYRTLGAADAGTRAAGSVVVVFDPGTTERELRAIVQSARARIIDGPTATHAYVLDIGDAKPTDVLESLRAQRAVTLAELLRSAP